MAKTSTEPFKFDEWMKLAASDPEAFEEQRRKAVEGLIARAPERYRQRLECLQWRVDMERRRATNPVAACVRISKMMLDSVYGRAGLANALNGKVPAERGSQVSVENSPETAKVLEFRASGS